MNARARVPTTFVVALVGVAGAATVMVATRAGLGVSADSTVYLAAARSLLEGRGLTAFDFWSVAVRPLVHYPPLYPALVALAGAATRDPVAGARVLNALLFGVNLVLAARLVSRLAPGWPWLAPFAALLLLASPDLLLVHTMAWSEPLFISWVLVALLLLEAHLRSPRAATRNAAGAAAALALLTRYVGVAVVITGVLGLLTERATPFRRRLRDAAAFASVSVLPLALWLVRNALVSGAPVDRSLAFHPEAGRLLHEAGSTVSAWVVAGRVRDAQVWVIVFYAELAAGALLVAGALFGGGRARDSAAGRPGIVLTASFVSTYLAVLVVNAWFFERDSRLDARALSPVHVTGLALAMGVTPALVRSGAARVALASLFLLAAGSHLLRGARWVAARGGDGLIYTNREWRESEMLARVRVLRPGVPIYSNAPEAIHFHAARMAAMLPEKFRHGSGLANASYGADLMSMRRRVADGDGAIVLFDRIERDYLPDSAELQARIPLRLLARTKDGALYGPAR